MTDRTTFDRIGRFSYDYTMGVSHDDLDFVLKIKALGIEIVFVEHEKENVGGIHLFHARTTSMAAVVYGDNHTVLQEKTRMDHFTGDILDLIPNEAGSYPMFSSPRCFIC